MAMARSGVIYYSKKSERERERVYVAKGRSNSGEIIQTEKKYSRSSETFQTSDKSVKVVVKERVSETVTIKTPVGMQSAKPKNSSTQAIKPPPAVKQQSGTRAIKPPAVKPERKSSTQVVKSPAKR